MSDPIPLAEAAQRTKLSWHRAWTLMLRGEFGDPEKRGGRWYVSADRVAYYNRRELARATPARSRAGDE